MKGVTVVRVDKAAEAVRGQRGIRIAGSVAHMGTGIGSQLNQKSPQCRMEESNRNATPGFQSAASRKKSECEEENEEEIEKRACEQNAVPRFKMQNSLIHNGKGKTISNSSNPIHSMWTTAMTTQEGNNASREWNEKRQDSRESSAKKKNKSRKEKKSASTGEAHGDQQHKARQTRVTVPNTGGIDRRPTQTG